MTIDDFAVAAQQEFDTIQSEMVTKKELKETKSEILRAIEGLEVYLSAHASRLSEDITKLEESMQEHDGRLRLLEKSK